MMQHQLRERLKAQALVNNIIFTLHAEQRMIEREISRIMVTNCLIHGRPVASHEYDKEHNSYTLKLRHYMAGVNYEVVVASPVEQPDAVIITVINKEDGYA